MWTFILTPMGILLSRGYTYVQHHNSWIIAVTEIIPTNYRIPVQKAELKIFDNYDIFPECISTKGRGITIQTHKDLGAQEVSMQTEFEESLWCEVKLLGHDKLLIGCIYQSESGTNTNNKLLNNLVKEANSKGYSHLLTMGDFNYKDIMWENWNTPTLSENSDEFSFIENLRDCYLYQHITKPTRIRQGQEPSILDLLITNEEGMIKDLEYLSPLGKSDHLVINFEFVCYIQQTKRTKELYCHDKGNYTGMISDLLLIKWEEELSIRDNDVNLQWEFIKEKIEKAMEKHIPKKKVQIGGRKLKCRLDKRSRDLIRKNTKHGKGSMKASTWIKIS